MGEAKNITFTCLKIFAEISIQIVTIFIENFSLENEVNRF